MSTSAVFFQGFAKSKKIGRLRRPPRSKKSDREIQKKHAISAIPWKNTPPYKKYPPLGKESQNLETVRISTDFGKCVNFELDAETVSNTAEITHFQGQNDVNCSNLAIFSRLRRSMRIIILTS